MERTTFTIGFLFLSLISMFATVQSPDLLLVNKDTLYMDVGWGHLSPLQTYFSQKNITYPFEMLHTGNYRGHVATWSIDNGILYLKSIDVAGKIHKPSKFLKEEKIESDNSIIANWFSGFLLARVYQDNNSYELEFECYYHLKHGKLIKKAKYTELDYGRMKKEFKNGKKPEEIEGIEMYLNYEKYLAYYFRMYEDESINTNNGTGFISRPNGKKLILQYYNDDHLKWPYNWESKDKSGIPVGKWVIDDTQILLSGVKLHSGLGFYETEIHEIPISEIFNSKEEQIEASWLNGIYSIQFRKEAKEKDKFSIYDYEIESIVILEIENGCIVEQCKIAGNFDFKKIDKNASKREQKLIQKYIALVK